MAATTVALAACGAIDDTTIAPDAVDDAERTGVPGWEADVRLTNNPAASKTSYNFVRDVAVTSDGAVHVVWYDARDGRPQTYYVRSRDGGTTWDPAVRIAASSESQEHASIAASGTNVYVGWHEQRSNGFFVVLARSGDSGATWGAPMTLSSGGVNAHPSIAADGDDVHIVFGDSHEYTEIVYLHSTNRGVTWATPQQITPATSESWVGSVTVSAKKVIVSWVDYRDANEEEYLRISNDGGVTFGAITRMTNNAADSWAPSVAISGDTVHFAWFDRRDSEYSDVDVEAALDSTGALMGLSFPSAPPRTPARYYLFDFQGRLEQKMAAIQASAPQWVMSGGNQAALEAKLVEYENRYRAWALGWEIYYKRSTDGGKTFGPDRRMTTAPYLSQRPSIVAVGERVDMIWFDSRDAGGADTEIYAASSTNGGVTWSDNQRLTTAPGPSWLGSIAATKDRLHIVWMDSRDGQDEIYYKRQLR